VVASGVIDPVLLLVPPVPEVPPWPDIAPPPDVPPIVPDVPPVADVPPAPDAPPAPDELLCAKAPTVVAASNAPAARRDSALDTMIYTLVDPSYDGLSEWSARRANISTQVFILIFQKSAFSFNTYQGPSAFTLQHNRAIDHYRVMYMPRR
jgi:hypothetical protein